MTEPAADKDALIAELGRTLARDARVADTPWVRYALIVRITDGKAQVNGFAYDDDGHARPATPRGREIHDVLQALREATRVPGKAPWGACVVRIERESGRIGVEFEYDHPEAWDVTPQNAQRLAQQAAVRV